MAWITSKTGRVYLAVCAGVTVVLLARDLPRLISVQQTPPLPPAIAPLPPQPPRTGQSVATLPPFVRAGYITALPPITMKAMDTVTLPSGAKFSASHLVRMGKNRDFVVFNSDGSLETVDAFAPASLSTMSAQQCYLQVLQQQRIPQLDQQIPTTGRWGGFSAANHRLIHGYAPKMDITLTTREQKTGKVECVIPQMPLAYTIAELPLPGNSRRTFRVDGCIIRYNADLLEYTLTLHAKTQEAVANDQFRVVLMGQGNDSRWQPVVLLPTAMSPTFSQGRNTPEEMRKEYRFRAVSQPSAPVEFKKLAVVLVPYQKVTMTGIVTKPKPVTEVDAKP